MDIELLRMSYTRSVFYDITSQHSGSYKKRKKGKAAKPILAAGVILNIGVLAVLKYADSFMRVFANNYSGGG